jgi:DNA-binding beta-propeller fold protein YncE
MPRALVVLALLLGSLLAPTFAALAQEPAGTPDPGAASPIPAASPAAAALAEFVREIDLGTGGLEHAAGGVAVTADGTLYVLDTLQNHIRVLDAAGNSVATWGESGAGPGQFDFGTVAFFWGDAAIGPDGNLYVLDSANARVQVLAPDGTVLREFGESGSGEGQFEAASGIDVDAAGRVYVADFANARVQVFDSDGQFVGAWAPDDSPFQNPTDVAVDGAGAVWVTDSGNAQIYRFDAEGAVQDVIGETEVGQLRQFLSPWGAAVDAAGNLYVAEYGGSRVLAFAPDGTPLGVIGGFGFGPGGFVSPIYLTIGPDGMLYVADEGTSRVLVFRLLPPLGAPTGTPVPA